MSETDPYAEVAAQAHGEWSAQERAREEIDALRAEIDALRSERDALLEACEAFENMAEGVIAAAGEKAGMQVPYFGDFASALRLPSFVGDMRRWRDRFRAAIASNRGGA